VDAPWRGSPSRSDGQPVSFWTYVINALRPVVPGVGSTALPLLETAQPRIETVLTMLLNELGAVSNDIVLVLDDYHLVDGPAVRTGMAFLLEHLPPWVHLVLSTRADPALPLARLRAHGELVEVRAADLPASVTTWMPPDSTCCGARSLVSTPGSLMYRSRRVPRMIPTMGLVGAPMLLAATTATLFGNNEQLSA
jgi:hypothetical protein